MVELKRRKNAVAVYIERGESISKKSNATGLLRREDTIAVGVECAEAHGRLGTRQAPLPIRVGEIEPVCARKDKEPQAAQKRKSDGHCRGATSLEAQALFGGDEAGGLHEELVAALLVT